MTLSSAHRKERLIKRFHALGPYIREEKCEGNHFFFDCLAICINEKLSPEIREFWGWWMDLEAHGSHFTYLYHFGLLDTEGNWKPTRVKGHDKNTRIEETMCNFHGRLTLTLKELDLELKPAADSSEPTKGKLLALTIDH